MDIMNEYTNMDEYATEFYNKMVVRLKEYCEIKAYALLHPNKYKQKMDEYKKIIDIKISLMKL